MKKLFFFAMLAVGMTAACQKPTVEVVDSDEPVAIQFGMNAPTVSVTKTKAPVDTWTTTSSYHVVGYNYHNNSEFLFDATGTPVVDDEGTATLGFSDKYYDVNYAYDFRAYYLGENKGHQGRTLDVTFEISGDEDIMAAKTNRAADLSGFTSTDGKSLTDEQMYSAYAARRNVHPSLKFEHMLTRLNITIDYANRDEDDNENLQVNLTNLKVNTRKRGTLSLAGDPTITFNGDTGTCDVPQDGKVMIEPGLSTITFNFDLDATIDGADQPGQTITIKAEDVIATDGSDVTEFEKGNAYNVTIKVYDLEAIEVSATLTAWGDGGDVTYDPDDNGWTPNGSGN